MSDPVFSDTEEGFGKKIGPFFGDGSIGSATHDAVTQREGVAVSAVVQVYSVSGGAFVDQVRSDENGAWEMTNLRIGKLFFARVRDREGDLNGAIADFLTPV